MVALNHSRAILSYRQTAEWGMREIQGSFERLRLPLCIDGPEPGPNSSRLAFERVTLRHG